jgi:nitrogen fixation protein NifB
VCGRVHLPVAPKCNIKCNYCDRRYDCVNESRPGVASAVLSPRQAALYMHGVMAREPSISVVGIAGPGDPLANPEETFGTLREIRKSFPDMLFCLSTNGLKLPEYVDELADNGVTHVTVTVNAVDPSVAQKVYAWVRDGKVIYRGRQAAELLLERQIEGIKGLKGGDSS